MDAVGQCYFSFFPFDYLVLALLDVLIQLGFLAGGEHDRLVFFVELLLDTEDVLLQLLVLGLQLAHIGN